MDENQLENNIELSQADQSGLLRLYQEVAAPWSLNDRMEKLSKNFERLLDIEQVNILVFELPRLALDPTGSLQNVPWKLVKQVIRDGKGLASLAYHTRRTTATANYWTDHSFEHIPELDEEIRKIEGVALINVPICQGNDVIGLMSGIKKYSYHWMPRDFMLAERVAEFAALAISNAQLHLNLEISHQKLEARTAELEKYAQELEARSTELEALQSFNKQLRGPLDLEELAKRAVYLAIEVLHTSYGALYLTDSANDEQLNLLGGFQYDLEGAQSPENLKWISPKSTKSKEASCWPAQIRFDEGLTGKAARLGQTMRVYNLSEEFQENRATTLAQPGIWQSGLFIPLWLGEKMIGTINLVSVEPRHFSAAQVHFAEMIAGQIAAAVHYVGQIEIERKKKEIAAIMALAHTAAHELNQPLTLLQGEVDMALQFGTPVSPEILERMQKSISLLAERVQAYQHIVRFETIEAVRGITILDPSKSIQK